MSRKSKKYSIEDSIPLVCYEKKRWKARLADNIHMVMEVEMGMQHEYSVLKFINDENEYIDVPTCFSLSSITTIDDENYYNIVPIFPDHQFYILLFANSYEFRYAGNASSLNRLERWFGTGDHIWFQG